MGIALPHSAVDPPRADAGSAPRFVTLPSGRTLDLDRSRWDGILDAEELAYCRTAGIALGFDTAQIGWVVLNSNAEADAAPPVYGGQDSRAGVSFRRWDDRDVAAHRALLDDRAVWEHLPESFPEPFTDETSRDLISLANADIGHEVVAVEVDGELVGQCLVRFDQPTTQPATAEVAYWLGRAHWGRGVMSRVLPAFIERTFERHPVNEIYAWIRPENVPSARVAMRAGLQRDQIPHEARVAASQGRSGFVRWAIRRPD